MKTFWIIIGAISVAAALAQADRVIPVDQDSMSRADALLGASRKKTTTSSTSNAGKTVAEEAKALKDADEETRKAFGQNVAGSRRQNGSQSPNDHASPNSNLGNTVVTGGSSDPRSHVPPQGSASSDKGRPSSPGKK